MIEFFGGFVAGVIALELFWRLRPVPKPRVTPTFSSEARAYYLKMLMQPRGASTSEVDE